MQDFIECVLIPFGILIVVIAVGMTLLIALLYPLQRASCEAKWEESGKQSKYGFWTGCLVSDDGTKWIAADYYRSVEKR